MEQLASLPYSYGKSRFAVSKVETKYVLLCFCLTSLVGKLKYLLFLICLLVALSTNSRPNFARQRSSPSQFKTSVDAPSSFLWSLKGVFPFSFQDFRTYIPKPAGHRSISINFERRHSRRKMIYITHKVFNPVYCYHA